MRLEAYVFSLDEKLAHFALNTDKLRDYCCYEI
jgi:hypothetical protein